MKIKLPKGLQEILRTHVQTMQALSLENEQLRAENEALSQDLTYAEEALAMYEEEDAALEEMFDGL